MTAWTPLPVWTPEVRMAGGAYTPEGWAALDSETANARIEHAKELREKADAAQARGSLTAGTLHALLGNAVLRAEHAQTHCTNSGQLRTECTTCDHTRQLALIARGTVA
jgi:hypothetical protein